MRTRSAACPECRPVVANNNTRARPRLFATTRNASACQRENRAATVGGITRTYSSVAAVLCCAPESACGIQQQARCREVGDRGCAGKEIEYGFVPCAALGWSEFKDRAAAVGRGIVDASIATE
jgi:hypothetical protein